ncbi:MAG: hypothetical protein ACRELX_14365, partial [Longimicrobiales bacterium]
LRIPRGGDGADAPEVPPAPVAIDYWLGADAASGVTLEILDAAGEVVATQQSGNDRAAGERDEQEMRGPPSRGRSPDALGTTAGLNRFWWDFRADIEGERSGPLLPPGNYTARLTVGDWTGEQSFDVLIDPRVAADGVTIADLREQYDFNRKVLALQADARALLEQVQQARENAQGSRATELDAILARLTERRDQSYPQPMLVQQISYLSGMTSSADQKVGRDAFQRYDELMAWLAREQEAFGGAGG